LLLLKVTEKSEFMLSLELVTLFINGVISAVKAKAHEPTLQGNTMTHYVGHRF